MEAFGGLRPLVFDSQIKIVTLLYGLLINLSSEPLLLFYVAVHHWEKHSGWPNQSWN